MNRALFAGLLMGLLLMAPLVSALDVTISPETPASGEEITATFPAPAGAVNATVQVCIGDICYIPAQLEEQGGVFRHTFYINETGQAHLNITVEYHDGSVTYDNATAFQVTETDGGNGTPGFTVGAVMAAVVAVIALLRRTKS